MQQMFEVTQFGLAVYLAILSILDIWKRRLPIWLLALGGITVMVSRIWSPNVFTIEAVAGGAMGAVFLLVGKATKEGFGYGDGLVITVMGIYLGIWNLAGVLLIAFFLSSLFALALYLIYKFSKKISYPFVPFLLVAYVLWLYLKVA